MRQHQQCGLHVRQHKTWAHVRWCGASIHPSIHRTGSSFLRGSDETKALAVKRCSSVPNMLYSETLLQLCSETLVQLCSETLLQLCSETLLQRV